MNSSMEEPSFPFREQGDENMGEEDEEIPNIVVKASCEAKLKELLHKINSIEIKLCSDATKEFIRLLDGHGGGELLHLYVQSSNKFSELLDAWKIRQGKPGLSYIVSLICAILSHPDGKYRPNDVQRIAISRVLDKFARSLLEEKLNDVYKELNSKEVKRQNAALLLMASIVRRGSVLASEVAKNFNFKLQAFSALAGYKQRQNERKRKNSTRKSFVGFAMSFLEIGKPGLLRWILQIKEMYSSVLRGLGSDDDEIITYVLSTLRDRVLIEESLMPPGLRSVLFGSVTLEQLISISGRENDVPPAQLAHTVLLMVCTDPCNGLMPDLKRFPNPLRGNPTRLLGLMKKLKATACDYHRDLLLAIVNGRPSLGSVYLEEFPYNLEDCASPPWFANVSLAANLVSSVGTGLSFDILNHSRGVPTFDDAVVQSIIKCICPRSFSRSVINKGLLHPDTFVKHGTLRLLLEALKLFDSLLSAINHSSQTNGQVMQSWLSLEQEIQNEARILLPDPQVFFTLLSSLSNNCRIYDLGSKRTADSEKIPGQIAHKRKKLKKNSVNEDTDIIVSGISFDLDTASAEDIEKVVDTTTADQSDNARDIMNSFVEIWGFDQCCFLVNAPKDIEMYFYTKLLDAVKIYLRTMPTALEGSFDFLINLLVSPLSLPINLQHSLLALLIEYIGWSPGRDIPRRMPPSMYKHIHPFIRLLIFSPSIDIKDQANVLSHAAMLSTGAFDRNQYEIGAWFLFLPGYGREKSSSDVKEVGMLQNLSAKVISFLCDAISTVGNNLMKYWDIIMNHGFHLKGVKGVAPNFSPLIICVLQKCLRLLTSESRTFTLHEKSIISLYVCNTLKYLLQTQVDAGLLSAVIVSILSESLENHCSVYDWGNFVSELRPLENLFRFSQRILHRQTCCFFSVDKKTQLGESSFVNILGDVDKTMKGGNGCEIAGIIEAFSSSLICTTPDEILKNFPSVMTISKSFLGVLGSILSSKFFLEQSFLSEISRSWPGIFFPGIQMAVSAISFEGPNKDPRIPAEILPGEEIISNRDLCASEAAAFSFFLKQVPFHVLFPAVISISSPYLSQPSKIQELLVAKLTGLTADCLVLYLRFVLFWVHQIRLSYIIEPSVELEQMSEICLIFIERVLTQLMVLNSGSNCSINKVVPPTIMDIQEVADTVFSHPAVTASLNCPLGSSEEFMWGNSGCSLETFLSLSKLGVHKLDHHVLNILTRTSEYVFSLYSSHQSTPKADDGAHKRVVKAFSTLVDRLLLELKGRFDLCIGTKDFMSILHPFYALQALIQFLYPFELLELVNWLFGRVDDSDPMVAESSRDFALAIGFCIAGGAFETLSTYLQQPIEKRVAYDLFWKTEGKTYDGQILEEIYMKISKYATKFELDIAYPSLLKAATASYRHKHMRQINLHPLNLVMSRVIMSSPIETLSHCIYRTNVTKAEFLFLVTEMSSVHMSIFGHMFFIVLNKDLRRKGDLVEETCGYALSDMDFLMLLPTALSYFRSVLVKYGKQNYKHFRKIPLLYSEILLKGFSHWKSFASGILFQENYGEYLPSSAEELLNLVMCSRLGKSIQMLWYHFSLSGDLMKTKKRLKLFNSIFPGSSTDAELLDCHVCEMDSNSLNDSLNHINRIIAKISFSRMLLFPIQSPTEDGEESDATTLYSSRLQCINNLVCMWQSLVRKFPLVSDSSDMDKNVEFSSLYNYLEVIILKSILELTTMMRDGLIQLESIPFLEQLMKSSLLYRFEDFKTLKMLRSILTVLLDGKFSRALYLQLLIAHSQFSATIQALSNSSGCSQIGVFLRPMSSILRSVVTTRATNEINRKSDPEAGKMHTRCLEVVKLLQVVIQPNDHQYGSNYGKEVAINYRELYALLLSSYGSTLSEIDQEIRNVMDKIESFDASNSEYITEMDYMWGSAALKVRKERALEHELSSNLNNEALVERRRSQFRENLPVDPKICASTVLYFPYTGTTGHAHEPLMLNGLESNNLKSDIHAREVAGMRRYDPVFILRFAIHSLSTGYLEPVEFTGLGLLAIAFSSISSADERIRKLGYETLGRFKNSLEKCQKRKDVMRLRLLLTYVQNGIEEPWQRIPSVITLFAAETSFILLDPSHDLYSTLSSHLMRSSRVNMKSIPLMHNFFWSSSVNFKTERLWVLRLLYAGLNSDDDAQIYIKNSIIEMLMSFYVSPLSEIESKGLILQIVKKSVRLHKMAQRLVEHCGLLSWLSSILSVSTEKLYGDEESAIAQLAAVLEVVNDVISLRNTFEFLQNHALEQLMELSYHLYKILVGGIKFMEENTQLVNSILRIITSTLEISQKRKIYQPHWTLAVECLFEIYHAVKNAKSSTITEFGLRAILMSTPATELLHTDRENLSSFLLWAISTALKSDSLQMQQQKETVLFFDNISDEELHEDSLSSKLLRWLTASIIIGKLSRKSNNFKSRVSKGSNLITVKALLEHVQNETAEVSKDTIGCQEILASAIFYLQQVTINFQLLPSVLSALCLLLYDSSNFSESGSNFVLHHGILVSSSLLSNIYCPSEADPAWRWSFYQPWKDLSLEQTNEQKIEELHSCQSLLVAISNVLRNSFVDLPILSSHDVEKSGVFEWEKHILHTDE